MSEEKGHLHASGVGGSREALWSLRSAAHRCVTAPPLREVSKGDTKIRADGRWADFEKVFISALV